MHRSFFIACALGIFSALFMFVSNIQRFQPRVVFCNVGQGDATYVRLPQGQDLLIDIGPNQQILSCLNQEMPFFDRHIDAIFLTHAQKDHAGELKEILRDYAIDSIFASPFFSQPDNQYIQTIRQSSVPFTTVSQGDELQFDTTTISILWPPKNKLSNLAPKQSQNDEALGISIVSLNKEILLLSDLDSIEGERALLNLTHKQTILKISHHGSQYGTSKKLLWLADPSVVVISVGKNNLYGHPHKLVLDLLKSLAIPVRRTDRDGTIRFPLE